MKILSSHFFKYFYASLVKQPVHKLSYFFHALRRLETFHHMPFPVYYKLCEVPLNIGIVFVVFIRFLDYSRHRKSFSSFSKPLKAGLAFKISVKRQGILTIYIAFLHLGKMCIVF